MAYVRSYVGEYWGRPVYEWIDPEQDEKERLHREEMVSLVEDSIGEVVELDDEKWEIISVGESYVHLRNVKTFEGGVWEESYKIEEVYEEIDK